MLVDFRGRKDSYENFHVYGSTERTVLFFKDISTISIRLVVTSEYIVIVLCLQVLINNYYYETIRNCRTETSRFYGWDFNSLNKETVFYRRSMPPHDVITLTILIKHALQINELNKQFTNWLQR